MRPRETVRHSHTDTASHGPSLLKHGAISAAIARGMNPAISFPSELRTSIALPSYEFDGSGTSRKRQPGPNSSLWISW
jgi:hypothetical protein